MADSVVLPLLRVLRQLAAYGAANAPRRHGLPSLPGSADAALLAHVACGLRTAHRVRLQPTAAEVPTWVGQAVQELRAAVALLQEWVVPE
jgi:hypothetical protein